jgi:hypothetical protein
MPKVLGDKVVLVAEMGRSVLRPYRKKAPAKVGGHYKLFVAAIGGIFALFVDILNDALENEKVGSALAGELDAIAVVPFHGAAKEFAIVEDDGHGCASLHLLNPIKILGVSHFWGGGLFAGGGPIVAGVLGSGWDLFLDVRETGTEHPAVHHDCSLYRWGWFNWYDAPKTDRVTIDSQIKNRKKKDGMVIFPTKK